MAKAPTFPMYVRDWLVDTERLSLAAQGAWMRICCNLHLAEPRGELTLKLHGWGRMMGCGPRRAQHILNELHVTGTSHVTNGDEGVTVMCRRMVRERKGRAASRLTTARWRKGQRSDEEVTPPFASASSSASAKKKESPPKPPSRGAVPSRQKALASGLAFNWETGLIEGITEAHRERWREAYPAVDIDQEILEAQEWQTSNPKKRKKNYRRFLTNWFARVQERGGGVASKKPGKTGAARVRQLYEEINKGNDGQ